MPDGHKNREEHIVRKRRAIIYCGNVDVADVLKGHFTQRGYDAMTYHEPVRCPLYEGGAACSEQFPCADIVIADFHLPVMNGLDLLRTQALNGCKVPAKNRALMSGELDEGTLQSIHELGCAHIQKPFAFSEIAAWLDTREPDMDLALPLGKRRKGKRTDCMEELECLITGSDEPMKGTALNRGPGGLCLWLARRVREGQAMTLRSGPPHAPRAVLVRWVAAQEDGSSLAGLQYA